MNNDTHLSHHSNEDEGNIGSIRQQIHDSPALQQAADRLIRDLVQKTYFEEEEEMLSLIIDQVQKGADLAERFPSFHQALTNNPALLTAFLDILELVDVDPTTLDGFVPPSKNALAFLQESRASSSIEVHSPSNWKIELKQTLENLQKVFSPAELAYRDLLSIFESKWFTLLREEIKFDHSNLEVVLDATISDKKEDSLEVLLHVIAYPLTEDITDPEAVSASLSWGKYHHASKLVLDSHHHFPLIAFEKILDSAFKNITADLTLIIQTV